MTGPGPHILEALGLDRDELTPPIESVPAPDRGVGYGFSAGTETLDALIDQAIPAHPIFSDVELRKFGEQLPGSRVRRWDADPSVVLVDTTTDDLVPGENASLVEAGTLALDSRTAPAFALVRGTGGELVLQVDRGGVTIFGVERRRSPELEDFAQRKAAPPLQIPSPDLDAILAGAPADPWLRDASTERAASASPLARAAAAGLIARLWSPPRGAGARALVDMALGGDTPTRRARDWFAALPADDRQTLERMTVFTADRLRDELPSLSGAIAADPLGSRDRALAWLHERDELACIRELLRHAGGGAELGSAEADLDREAASHHSMWSALESFSTDPWLRAVAWQEPDSWWGALAR